MVPRHGLPLFIHSLFWPSSSSSIPPLIAPLPSLLRPSSSVISRFLPPLFIPPSLPCLQPFSCPQPHSPPTPLSAFFLTSLISIPPIQLLFITSTRPYLDYFFLLRTFHFPFHCFPSLPLILPFSSPFLLPVFSLFFSSAIICPGSYIPFPPLFIIYCVETSPGGSSVSYKTFSLIVLQWLEAKFRYDLSKLWPWAKIHQPSPEPSELKFSSVPAEWSQCGSALKLHSF